MRLRGTIPSKLQTKLQTNGNAHAHVLLRAHRTPRSPWAGAGSNGADAAPAFIKAVSPSVSTLCRAQAGQHRTLRSRTAAHPGTLAHTPRDRYSHVEHQRRRGRSRLRLDDNREHEAHSCKPARRITAVVQCKSRLFCSRTVNPVCVRRKVQCVALVSVGLQRPRGHENISAGKLAPGFSGWLRGRSLGGRDHRVLQHFEHAARAFFHALVCHLLRAALAESVFERTGSPPRCARVHSCQARGNALPPLLCAVRPRRPRLLPSECSSRPSWPGTAWTRGGGLGNDGGACAQMRNAQEYNPTCE